MYKTHLNDRLITNHFVNQVNNILNLRGIIVTIPVYHTLLVCTCNSLCTDFSDFSD